MANHICRGCVLATNALVVAFVVDTALGPPIYWCLSFAADVIGLALPTNAEDGIKWWIVVWISVLSKFTWETCFLTKLASSGLPFFLFVPFGGLLLDALFFFCIVRLVSFRVSSSISHFVFPLHGYAMNRGGVLVCRALSTLVLTLLLIPPHHV